MLILPTHEEPRTHPMLPQARSEYVCIMASKMGYEEQRCVIILTFIISRAFKNKHCIATDSALYAELRHYRSV